MDYAEHVFDSTPRPIADLLAELNSVTTARVTRDAAMSVSSVQRGRNEVCSLATLPIRLYRGLDVVDHPLFRQFDPDVPNVVHIAQTIEDLIFEGRAWWLITGQDFDSYPVSVRYVPVGKVSLEPPPKETPPPGRWVWVDGVRTPMTQVIRFDSPNPGVLVANARAIRCAMLLDGLALTYADNPRPLDYFTDTDDPNVEPFSDDQWRAFLARWRSDRKRTSTARVPGQVKRVDVNAPSPAELQLVELKRQVTLEIANGLGVDAEDLGVSTTSRTYFNAQDRRISKINEGRRPIMKAITDRLTMGDVTRRGHFVAFDLSEYLEADPASQAAYWEALQRMGVTDANEIRGWAKLPGRAPTPTPAALPTGAAAIGRAPIRVGDVTPRFAAPEAAFTFDRVDFAGDAPAPPTVDTEGRKITGLAVPYGAVARKYGIGFRFLPGSLEYGSNVKHFKDHVTPVGNMIKLEDAPGGPTVTLSVLSGPDGSPQRLERDQLLYDAENGLYNGLSVGVDFDLENPDDATYNQDEDVWDVRRATLREVSTTSMPAFDDARVTQVAASLTGGTPMFCQHCGQQHAPGVACSTHAARVAAANTANFTQPTGPTPAPAPVPAPGGPPVPAPPTQAPPGVDQATFNAWAAFQQAQQQVGTLANSQTVREFVNAGHQAVTQVIEPSPYRFDRKGNLRKGSHDFLTDLQAGWQDGDQGARDRVQSFVQQSFGDGSAMTNLMIQKAAERGGQFAVTSGNVSALNPNRNRPDMYVDQMEYDYPIWDAIDKGTLEDITPFVVPKYNSSSGLVANHVEGTEPTPGAFTATAQTITPSAVSGKVEYTREAWDQGGNPQASGLIWTQMVRGYYEALEAYAVAQLAAVAASIPDITITTAAVDATLDQALADAIVPLNYIRGGNRFNTAYTQIDLYKALAKAKDSAGRRLYPEIGPQNAMGTTDAGYKAIRAHGINWLPAWALAATGSVAASSYAFDRQKVCGWATAPQRIDITWRVAWVDIGIWGYKAFAVTDYAGTREFVYDPV